MVLGEDYNPVVAHVLTVKPDLSFKLLVDRTNAGHVRVRHLVRDKFHAVSQVVNVMSLLSIMEVTAKDKVKQAIEILDSVQMADLQPEQGAIVKACAEQLRLSQHKRQGWRFSQELLLQCCVWFRVLPKLYRQIYTSKYFIIPSPKSCRRLLATLKFKGAIDKYTESYFKLRAARLADKDKVVHMAIDKVHTTQGLELAGESIHGGADGKVTKALLCTHIHSIVGSASDMVSMLPVVSSTTEVINRVFVDTTCMLTKFGYIIVTVSFDGHRISQSWFNSLGEDGKPPVSIPCPSTPQDREKCLFLMFDSVHLLKSAFYQLLNKGKLHMPRCPGAGQNPNLPRIVKLGHLDTLLWYERYKGLKSGHKLTHKVLHPSNIEQQSMSLAMAATHDSTVTALQLYADQKHCPEFHDTADFLELLQRWLKICNVRGKDQDKRWNDPLRKVIELGCDQSERNLKFLREVGDFMKEWYKSHCSPKHKFSKDMALGMYCTSRGMSAASQYVPDKHKDKGISFLCLCKMSSDAQENAFGQRQRMCGSNYWTQVRQFFESKAIIRRVNLVHLSRYTLEEVAEGMQTAREEPLMQDTQVVQVLVGELSDLDPELPKDLLAAAAGHFSGCLGRTSKGDLSYAARRSSSGTARKSTSPPLRVGISRSSMR